ncbi:hypothetical protein WS67_03615 [Burkholderia singularis]|uniref:Uncharacterized protein n=1 Tax=Burkholderia singularis TaxID=1503053 RepID=A0A103E7W7_9BURK|nr:hypothetical protein WS67_03615 [Burkholderia singularis]
MHTRNDTARLLAKHHAKAAYDALHVWWAARRHPTQAKTAKRTGTAALAGLRLEAPLSGEKPPPPFATLHREATVRSKKRAISLA